MTISMRLNELVNQIGISRYDVAKALDITPQSVYNWFKPIGGTTPTLDNLIKFLEVYDISPIEFLKGFDLPDLTAEQKSLLELWLKLSREDKDLIMPLIKKFAQGNH